MGELLVGLDLAQSSDFTAIVVAERNPTHPVRFDVRHLERIRHQPYPAIVRHVQALVGRPPLSALTEVVTDATGVGRPVVDALLEAGLAVVPVIITGGDTALFDLGVWRVPKRDLIQGLLILLEQERLKFAAGLPLVDVLTRELLDVERKISEAGRDTYGAWREGAHDDLVLATALACWFGLNQPPPGQAFVSASRPGFRSRLSGLGGSQW